MDQTLDVIRIDSVDIKDIHDDSAQASPVIKYMYIVQKISKSVVSDDAEQSGVLFFRGQSKESWRVDPSVFREGQLGIEHMLISEAIRHRPNELANNLTNFERLTKLQHYELSTRLLDITENPLVALFFACEKEKEFDGAVYMTCAYPIYAGSPEVQILSHIAHLDLKGMTLCELWISMQKNGIDVPAYEDITDLDAYITLMKQNYFVRPNLDNARIKQQRGAFLLSGCINILAQDDKSSSTLEKKDRCLATEFTHKIIIPSEMKDELLEELDLYNVNEATVYPELDHQMHYIKKKLNKTYAVFFPAADVDSLLREETATFPSAAKSIAFELYDQNQLALNDLHDIVSTYIQDVDLVKAICEIFMENARLDWPIRKQLQADISRRITRHLYLQGYNHMDKCSEVAKSILEDAIYKLKM